MINKNEQQTFIWINYPHYKSKKLLVVIGVDIKCKKKKKKEVCNQKKKSPVFWDEWTNS